LEVETDAYLIRSRDEGEKAVVITFASAQPVALFVEAHAGDNGEFYLSVSLFRK